MWLKSHEDMKRMCWSAPRNRVELYYGNPEPDTINFTCLLIVLWTTSLSSLVRHIPVMLSSSLWRCFQHSLKIVKAFPVMVVLQHFRKRAKPWLHRHSKYLRSNEFGAYVAAAPKLFQWFIVSRCIENQLPGLSERYADRTEHFRWRSWCVHCYSQQSHASSFARRRHIWSP